MNWFLIAALVFITIGFIGIFVYLPLAALLRLNERLSAAASRVIEFGLFFSFALGMTIVAFQPDSLPEDQIFLAAVGVLVTLVCLVGLIDAIDQLRASKSSAHR